MLLEPQTALARDLGRQTDKTPCLFVVRDERGGVEVLFDGRHAVALA
jgi:hypothetical protein